MEQYHTPPNDAPRNPASYTLGEAAIATGKSKSTLARAVKDGRISASREQDGSYHIDLAELHRVFPPVSLDSAEDPLMTHHATHDEALFLRRELEIVREERERERGDRERERRQMEDTINDLRHRLDEESAERRKANMLLTHKPPEPEAKKGIWARMFWRKS